MNRWRLRLWMALCLLVLFACRWPEAPGTPLPTASSPARLPTSTAGGALLPGEREEATATRPAARPSEEQPAAPAPSAGAPSWPTAIPAADVFSQGPATPEEMAALERLEAARFVENDPIALAVAIKGLPVSPNPQVIEGALPRKEGEIERFWIKNQDTNQWAPVEARLERVSEHAYLWFDTAREPAGRAAYDSAAQAFEQVYDRIRAVYGSEWSPGIDGDRRIYVVHAGAEKLCRMAGSGGSLCNVLGYFSSLDELPAAVEPHSNQHELFVMNVDAGRIGGERYLLTLAHELRHMIEYNYDRNDEDWEVEGTAVMAEDLAGYPRLAGDYGDHFTAAGTDLQLNAWTQGDSIPYYGVGYVFARYLFHRMGQEFYSAWVQHPENGLAALDEVLQAGGYGFSTVDLWLDWAVAVSLMGFENVPFEYSFGEEFYVNPPNLRVIDRFPRQLQERVNQFAFDVYEVRAGHPLRVGFLGASKVATLENRMPASGEGMWWSGRANQSDSWLARRVDLRGVERATLKYAVSHSIETGYDFAYVMVSLDGGKTWQGLSAPHMQGEEPQDDPAEAALLERFYTGRTDGWLEESIDLSPFAGREIWLRFQIVTDPIYTEAGLALDNIAIPEIGFFDDAEQEMEGWEGRGFTRVTAYLPQRFHLVLVEFGEGNRPVARRIPVADDNTAGFEIRLGEGSDRALLIVAASTPLILTPVDYQLSFTP